MGPPSGDRWIGNYAMPDGSPGWIFDLRRSGGGWAGSGYRANDPAERKSSCQGVQLLEQ
jgi:hypothetical protein